jgi:hypothetical protein
LELERKAVCPLDALCGTSYKNEEEFMNAWQLIFFLSRVNNGGYDEDRLPILNWRWPEETWFQKRLRDLRPTMTYNRILGLRSSALRGNT